MEGKAQPNDHKAIVIGATGGIGRTIVRLLATDPRVESVTAVVRRPRDVEFYGLTEATSQKLNQVVADFDQLDLSRENFAGHTVGLSGLGIYTRDAQDEAHFRKIEVEYNVNAARLILEGGATRFAYLSGGGADPTEKAFVMFARVKGAAENALRELGFDAVSVARPAVIFGRPNAGGMEGAMNRCLGFLARTNMGIHSVDIAKAMVQAVVGAPPPMAVMENKDLKGVARQYELAKAEATAAAATEGRQRQ